MDKSLPLNLTPLLTDRQVATLLNVSRSQVWAKAKTGEWPRPIKLSDRVTRWKASDILSLIKQREV